MKVRVLVAGIYNGPGHRALPWALPGDVIEVADEEYGCRLIDLGRVVDVQVQAEPGPTETQVQPGPVARKRGRVTR